jgi:hypothetical protein
VLAPPATALTPARQDWRSGPERDSVAVRMQNAGYRTLYAGKYLNTYGTGDPLPSHVPPGWSVGCAPGSCGAD